MEVNSGADLHLQPVEHPNWSRWMSERGCDPMESLSWSRLLAGPANPWKERSPHWSRFAGRTCDSVEDPHWSNS